MTPEAEAGVITLQVSRDVTLPVGSTTLLGFIVDDQ